jgi:hypothetical protein
VDKTVTEDGWSFEVLVTVAEAMDELKKPACCGGIEAKKSILRKLTRIISSNISERLVLIY